MKYKMRGTLKIFFLLLLLCGSAAQAQPGDKVEALRVSFIARKLELSTSEAEKFWPVYNEYHDKLQVIKKNLRQSYKRQSENLSEAEAEELYQIEMQSRQAELNVHRQYGDRMKSIIGARKMVKLHMAEEEFKRELIKNIKDKNE
jgi:hypothetical protein